MGEKRAVPGPPWVHFLLLGLVLWIGHANWRDWQFRQIRPPSEATLEALTQDWSRSHGRMASPGEREALLQQELDRRILFKEALRLGLHRRDPVVLRRLRQDIEFLQISVPDHEVIQTALDMQLYLGDEVIRRRLLERMRSIGHGPEPIASDEQLRLLHGQHAQRWLSAPRVSFRQIYLRAENAERLPALLRQLAPGATWPGDGVQHLDHPATHLGDAFLHGTHFRQLSPVQLDKLFGPAFRESLMTRLEERREDAPFWLGPLESRYGLHLLGDVEYQPAQARPFEQLRGELQAEWRREQQQAHFERWMQHLRARYRVRT